MIESLPTAEEIAEALNNILVEHEWSHDILERALRAVASVSARVPLSEAEPDGVLGQEDVEDMKADAFEALAVFRSPVLKAWFTTVANLACSHESLRTALASARAALNAKDAEIEELRVNLVDYEANAGRLRLLANRIERIVDRDHSLPDADALRREAAYLRTLGG